MIDSSSEHHQIYWPIFNFSPTRNRPVFLRFRRRVNRPIYRLVGPLLKKCIQVAFLQPSTKSTHVEPFRHAPERQRLVTFKIVQIFHQNSILDAKTRITHNEKMSTFPHVNLFQILSAVLVVVVVNARPRRP